MGTIDNFGTIVVAMLHVIGVDTSLTGRKIAPLQCYIEVWVILAICRHAILLDRICQGIRYIKIFMHKIFYV